MIFGGHTETNFLSKQHYINALKSLVLFFWVNDDYADSTSDSWLLAHAAQNK